LYRKQDSDQEQDFYLLDRTGFGLEKTAANMVEW